MAARKASRGADITEDPDLRNPTSNCNEIQRVTLVAAPVVKQLASKSTSTIQLPGAGYAATTGRGVLAALAILAGLLPLLGRITRPQTARFERFTASDRRLRNALASGLAAVALTAAVSACSSAGAGSATSTPSQAVSRCCDAATSGQNEPQ
ncbi:hypothetical protein [Actinospica robiniae]|uniref:Uncharacterized protein n=1 Tax=Actinospica robiniae DSM 44927 TaxID=479430 RepID=W9DZW6_9ACTN|nr:hypothetical protein [Actinospica robiniae]ETA71145.1 hypothetical protein ActroDRAFT_0171 [Actinospica robiniae DSM 44927]